MVISGPTMSGKSTWMKELLLQRQNFISPSPDRIIWLFKRWQPLYDDLKRQIPILEFIQGLTADLDSEDFQNPDENTLLIIDDLMKDSTANKDVCEIFVEGAHHRNMSIVCIMQNIFNGGKENRTMNLNSQYLVLFKNPRDKLQISNLARQMYPGHTNILLDAYHKAVDETPHGSLVVDLKQTTPESKRLQTNIFLKKMPPVDFSEVTLKRSENNILQPFCLDCGLVFATSYDLGRHTALGCNCEEDSEEDTDTSDQTDDEDDTVGFDMMINTVWNQHDPLFQDQVTKLVQKGVPTEEARETTMKRMLEKDRNLLLKNYKEQLKLSACLMKSALHRSIRQEILSLINENDVPLEDAISCILDIHHVKFNHLFQENK